MRRLSTGRVSLGLVASCLAWAAGPVLAADGTSSIHIRFASGAGRPPGAAASALAAWAYPEALHCWRVLDERRGRCDIVVSSYSDSLGTVPHDLRLCGRRAYAVVGLLQQSGISLSWVHSIIVGPHAFAIPPSECSGSLSSRRKCEAPNRRVVVSVRILP